MDQQPTPMPIPAADPRLKDVEMNKDLAALSYAWVLSVFMLLYRRHSPFTRFHARQGTVLFVLSILFWFVPAPFDRALLLLVLAGCVAGFVSAAQGRWRELPFVYAISRGDPRLLRSSWKSVVQGVATLWRRIRNRAGQTEEAEAQSDTNRSVPPTPVV